MTGTSTTAPGIDAVLAQLTLAEKCAFLAGADLWSTPGIPRLGIPPLAVTDGPSGARGPGLPGGGPGPSTCIPCGSALGATWDLDLVEAIGALVGHEAIDRGCRALLAPTVNLHRAVLAGRNFECYSEDPLLSGALAAAFVRGVQANGVIATVKHFVGNEQEHERASISAEIDDRALRELYLLPFEMAVRDGGALGIMTAYNRLNGRWLTEQPEMLLGVLRDEWGFQGLVMTDWFAVTDTERSAGAGVDLEMPGPPRAFGERLIEAVEAGRVDEADVDAAVLRQLAAWAQVGALDGPALPVAPQTPTEHDIALTRAAAVASVVLLRNDGVLPLDPVGLTRVALIGPNADSPRIMGGGSSEVTPHRLVTPLEALRETLGPGVVVVHERGCEIDRSPRPVGGPGLRAPDGFTVEYFAGVDLAGASVANRSVEQLRILHLDALPDVLTPNEWSMRVSGRIVAPETGVYRFGLGQSGRARVFVNGELVLDGVASPPPPGGTDFFGFISQDLECEVELDAGVPAEVAVEYATVDALLPGFRVGFHAPGSGDPMASAEQAAAVADVAIVVVGTSAEWESESRDRTSFQLPGDQDELVRRVAAANPRTIVVVNAGSVVDLPWADDVAAVLQCWFGGQEMAAAIVDVLTGAAEPSGRLATTIPHRVEHSPSWDNFPGENGAVRYGEGVFMGYRGYEHRRIEPRFPFGHGLGYTTFALGEPDVSATTFAPGGTVTITVPVTNTGDRRGSEVVQLYVAPRSPRLARPPKELKAFAKVHLEPGETRDVELVLGDRAFAYWDPGQADWEQLRARLDGMVGVEASKPGDRRAPGWQVDAGPYDLLIGRSSTDITHRLTVEVV